MSISRTFEDQCLGNIRHFIEHEIASQNKEDINLLMLDILEGAASVLGGFKLTDYRNRFIANNVLTVTRASELGFAIAQEIRKLPMHHALALSALARPTLAHSHQRLDGVYHTDFRLANYVAGAIGNIEQRMRIIDPACGSGILLVATAIQALNNHNVAIDEWLAQNVYARDLSQESIRGARLALSSLTRNIEAMGVMDSHWSIGDSLFPDEGESPAGFGEFDLVVGNPPWEKVKATRHEYLRAHGSERHYGAEYDKMDETCYFEHRSERLSYAQRLVKHFTMMGDGEPDLYKPFLELSLRLAKPGGRVAIFVPAGLIRSQGTESIRRSLSEYCSDLKITVFENRARFFAIDTRFKFLLVLATLRKRNSHEKLPVIKLVHGTGLDNKVQVNQEVLINTRELIATRPDLTIPEVKKDSEWKLFRSFSNNGVDWGKRDSEWFPEIVREVDMTRNRPQFLEQWRKDSVPVIEGRMIHQHRFGCKAYRSGTGRRAMWEAVPFGSTELTPQFWFPVSKMTPSVLRRHKVHRAGFCDITGQTNERSMLAALVPPGVVCGNKVPTVTFPNDPSPERLDLWLGIVNSLPFDWMLRRVLTTTVNYFLLLSIPLPPINKNSSLGRHVIRCSRELRRLNSTAGADGRWLAAELRAEIDIAVLKSYGGTSQDMETIFADFPLIDRGQPPVGHELRSTVTRDLIWQKLENKISHGLFEYSQRVSEAARVGACAYVPAQFAPSANDLEEIVHA